MGTNEAITETKTPAMPVCIATPTIRGYDVQRVDARGPDHPTVVLRHDQTEAVPPTDYLRVLRVVSGPENESQANGVDGFPIDMRVNYSNTDISMRMVVTGLAEGDVQGVAESVGGIVFLALQSAGAL